jgi:cell division protease FtsH
LKKNLDVIVMAATNRGDILDPALLRPGRFDRKIILDAPMFMTEKPFLKIHSGKTLISILIQRSCRTNSWFFWS